MRTYRAFDAVCQVVDQGLRTLAAPAVARRPNPSQDLPEASLTTQERKYIGALMRINHAGEIAAQGLYHGQALTAKSPAIQEQMTKASQEETDHLAWCVERLEELHERPSLLSPLWYWGAFSIGAAAGAAGDRWSLGFVAETEKQVVEHLAGHLDHLPPQDLKTKRILETMQQDEAQHRQDAIAAGGVALPQFVQTIMKKVSAFMIHVSRVF